MGIYDREYYRDETGGSGWFSGVAPACKAIVLINVGVFLARWVVPDLDVARWLAASSTSIFEHGTVWQLITAPFLHLEPWHLLFNMLFFWFAGRELEAMYGTRDFVLMYVTAAIVSTFGWAMLDYLGPDQGAGYMLGASGAVMAVMVIYALYYPRREVLLFFILPVQIWLLLVLFLGMDFLQLMQELRGGPSAGVAFASHLMGAGYGYLYKTHDLRWSHLLGRRRFRPRLRVLSPEPREKAPPLAPTPARPSGPSSAPRHAPSVLYAEEPDGFEERLDQVLAKLAQQGRAALTEEENRILQEASRRARARRSDRV